MDNTQHPGARRWLALLLLVQLGLSLLYMFYVPAFEKRDEEMHFEVISFFRHEKRLPDFRSDPPARVHEFFQPPLYHALSALIIAPLPESDPPLAVLPSNRFGYVFKGSAVPDNANRFLHNPDDLRFPWKGDWLAIYTLRFAALLMGLGTTFAMYHLARTVFQSESAALGATLWLILRPSILFETTAVTNDPLLLLLGTLLLLITARTIVEGVTARRTVWMGIVLGLMALTKYTWAASFILWPAAFILAPGFRGNWKRHVAHMLASGALAWTVAGWYFARNLVSFGHPIGLRVGSFMPAHPEPPTLTLIAATAWNSFQEYWAVFHSLGMPDSIEWLFAAVSLAMLAGTALYIRRGGFQRELRRASLGWLCIALLAAYLLQMAGMYSVTYYGLQNRFTIAGYGGMAILMQCGVSGWLSMERKQSAGWIALAFLLPLNLLALFGILKPAFDLPQRFADPSRLDYEIATDARFGDTIRLIGYSISAETVRPGDDLTVRLCWESQGPLEQAIPYGVYLIDDQDAIIASRGTHPGLGMYPTAYWEQGVYFCDDVRIPVDASTNAPLFRRYFVTLRFFDEDTLEILPASFPNGDSAEIVFLEEVALLPDRLPSAGTALYTFADRVAVEALTVERDQEQVAVTVTWRALADLDRDYTVFVHVLGSDETFVTQLDTPPGGGAFPTRLWPSGLVYTETLILPLPDGQSGELTARLGLYDSLTLERLPLSGGDTFIDLGSLEEGR